VDLRPTTRMVETYDRMAVGLETHDYGAVGLKERERERNIPVSKRVAGGEMERVIRDCVISSHI